MYYEDVEIQQGETLLDLTVAYGHEAAYRTTIWQDPRNSELRAARDRPERMEPGDRLYMPIPWKIMSASLSYNEGHTWVILEAHRSGNRGTRLRWVQTVDRGNQPYGEPPYGAPRRVVDPSSPPTDDQPFYYTQADLDVYPDGRFEFSDSPVRRPPNPAMGMSKWRALLSVAVVTGKRVTVVDTRHWGFDQYPSGNVRGVPARLATLLEVREHLDILRNGFGLGPGNRPGTMAYFRDLGWTFRTPPPPPRTS